MARDVATTLPAEIWLHVFSLLGIWDIRSMMKVHRAFYTYSRPFLWRSLVLCTLESKDRWQAKAIIRNPTLGQHITELNLRPTFSLFGGTRPPIRAWTSIWVADPPIQTWFGLLSRIDWHQPRRSLRHFTYSQKTLSTALAVIPHLTGLRKLWVSPRFIPGSSPNPEPYYKLWSNLQTNHLTSIAFSLPSWASLQIFSGALSNSRVTFPCLETLDLHIFVPLSDNYDPDQFERGIRVIADAGRDSLRFLRLASPPWDAQFSSSKLFSGIGFFPHLIHFDYTAFSYEDEAPVTRFIARHRSSLDRLNITGFVHQLFPRLLVSGSDNTAIHSMNLTSLVLKYRVKHDFLWSIGEPSLRSYADTLTTLIITPYWWGPDAFSYQDIDRLVSSLYRSPNGALLQQFKIPITYLCPEVFDLLSNRLENLHTLEILYHALVACLDSEAEEPLVFWENMGDKTYPNWKIQWFNLDTIDEIGTERSRKEVMHRVFKLAIPSIKKFEARNWTDLEVKIESHH
ncbi:hypothetical protein BDN72DRAFT_964103 [Pluteus cervinus]|uniref:Uncharacterized protein n=1 Tax=Pluteus cervinus TaxID=181527 RepID=A0ACD3ACB4_9AGAR|nr:hypothetical protein BDN72DRAFT_964103 [Pluteus cervinus]